MSTLLIHSCEGVVWSRRKAPNLYVVCQQEGQAAQRTVVVKRDRAPKWEHIYHLSSDSAVTLRLWHDSLLKCRDVCLGTVRTELATLRDTTNNDGDFIKLRLTGAGQQSNGKSTGTLLVRLMNRNEGVTMAVGQAQHSIQQPMDGSSPSALLDTAGNAENSEPVTQTLEAGLSILIAKLHLVVCIGNEIAKIHPYANIAWTVLTSVYQVVKKQQDTDEQMHKLVNTMVSVYAFVEETELLAGKIKMMEDKVLAIVQQTVQCALFIREYMCNGFTTRAIRSLWQDTQKTITDLSESLLALKNELETGLTVQGISLAIQKLDELVQSDALKMLDPMKMNATLRPICLKGTRVQLLKDLTEWLMDPSESGRFLWLTGVAGCGKSTISTTISDTFRGLHRLGAFLFFDRNDPSHSQPGRVIATLAHSLAHLDSHIGNTISAALRDDPNIVNAPIGTQFKTLLLDPLLSAQQYIHGPILIVLDALDECGDSHSRRSLLSVITAEFVKLPPVFRFLITSRREADLSDSLGNHFVERSVAPSASARDVQLFIQNELEVIRQKSKLRLSTWPTPIQLQTLTDLAGGLFIWAATAVKFIDGYKPNDRMESLISDNVKTLDQLYTLTLQDSASWDDPKFARDARAVLACIVFGQVPMTATTIDALLGADYDSAEVLKSLGCVVHWRPGCVCRILHASFADYLTDTSRSKGQPWAITTEFGHHSLVSGCLRILNSDLRFNICNLEDSHVPNEDVPDISNRVASNITPQLSYSSRFWGLHLTNSTFDPLILESIHKFFQLHFLFWLEVLSLVAQVPITSAMLKIAADYVKDHDDDLADLIIDTTKFISAFSPLIAQSAPHLYISAVPFVPKGSRTMKEYMRWFHNTVGPDDALNTQWPAIQKVLQGHTEIVNCVAFSLDGTRVASGSSDKTVRIWDIHTGQLTSTPLQHESSVQSVKFSPDSTQIASVSDDKVRVWDTQTGTLVAAFTGPNGTLNTVLFSPSGRCIAAGYIEHTLHLWDARTGILVAGPLDGNATGYSVNFSPDGTHMVFGSRDGTVHVWNVQTGTLTAGPLIGHTAIVQSVCFSPDSKCIASGSRDRTVRVWNAHTGTLVAGPFVGHRETLVIHPFTGDFRGIESVCFSPDSTQIACGSDDGTVYVWDAKTGEVCAGPFRLPGERTVGQYGEVYHSNSVFSVHFSSDGRQIVCGSKDRMVYLWDTLGCTGVAEKFRGHADGINCVCFSPDGTKIATGGEDTTVSVWDSQTGELVTDPFIGHTHRVVSVDFSPDGMQIVSGSEDHTVRVWDVQTRTFAGPIRHNHAVRSVHFSPDGTQIASCSDDYMIHVWDAQSYVLVAGPLTRHNRPVQYVGLSPNNRWITSRSWSETVVFSPDSRLIAAVAANGHTFYVVDAQSSALVTGPFTGHGLSDSDYIDCVQFSPDGMWVASGSAERILLVWDAHTGALAAGPFTGHTGRRNWISSVCFSPDGTQIASGSSDKTVRVCKVGPRRSQHNAFTRIDAAPENSWEELYTFNPESGWVRNTEGGLILWVPPWLREGFYLPHNTVVLSPKGTTKVDYSCFVHGTEWVKCFGPEFANTGSI